MSSDDLAILRTQLARSPLNEDEVDLNPFVQFERWFQQALTAQVTEPTAMALATSTSEGRPSLRIVLMKSLDERGVVFFTNYDGRKSVELLANPHAALLFHWQEIQRQVRIEGAVEKVSRKESEDYFQTRPFESKLSAWASRQSSVIAGRGALEQKMKDLSEMYGDGLVPLPPYWGGFRVQPVMFEFWQGRTNRLHDRIRYTRDGGVWSIERLAP